MTEPPRQQGRTAKGVKKYRPSGVAIWSVPAVDLKRGQLVVTTGDNYSEPATGMSDAIVGLDLDTGRTRWVYQALADDIWNTACWFNPKGAACPEKDGPDYDFGAGPVITATRDGTGVVLAGQKSGWVYAVDADHGKLRWKTRIGRGGMLGGIHFGLAAIDDTLFVPVSDIEDGRQHDMAAQPGLFALDIGTGAVKWRTLNTDDVCNGRPFCDAGLAATITTTPGLVFAGGLDGWVRAYDSATGKVLWRMDTTTQFETVGGGKAAGGSMQGITAPLLYHGTVIMVSGYDFTGRMPGNLLLVLETR
jgi:polyvinyl alcohol dehydrogenase (cytochrome)